MDQYENAIEISNLRKCYGGFTLGDISFNVPRGSIMGLIGQNGAGKSTTMCTKFNAFLTLLTERTKSIYPASFCHMINNNLSVEFLILLFVSEVGQETLNNAPSFTNISAFWLLMPFVAVTGAVSFILLIRKR